MVNRKTVTKRKYTKKPDIQTLVTAQSEAIAQIANKVAELADATATSQRQIKLLIDATNGNTAKMVELEAKMKNIPPAPETFEVVSSERGTVGHLTLTEMARIHDHIPALDTLNTKLLQILGVK